jgi:chitodextrinase
MTLQRSSLLLTVALLGLGTSGKVWALSAPAALVATATSSTASRLTWTDKSVREIGFAIERSPTAHGGFVEVGRAGNRVTSYEDSGLASLTRYYYRVRAIGRVRYSAYSNVATTETPADEVAPAEPTSLRATPAGCRQIDLTWSPSTDTGGSGLKGYNVYRGGSFVGQVLAPATAMSDTTAAPATTYTYTVAAVDNAENVSKLSSGRSAVTPACPTPTPTLTSTPIPTRTPTPTPIRTPTPTPTSTPTPAASPSPTGDGAAPSVPAGVGAQALSCNQVSATWNPSSDSGGSGLRSYDVYRNGTFVRQVVAPSTSLTDAGLSASTVYSYAVSATDNAGNVSGLSSAAITNTPACDGVVPWARRFGGTGSDGALAVAADAYGNLLVAGYFNGTAGFGGASLVSAGAKDVFVAKYTAAGGHLWSRRLGGAGDDQVRGLAVDRNGDLVLIGDFSGTSDFGGASFTSAGPDVFLVGLRGMDGGHRWSKQLGASGNDRGYAVAVDGQDNVVATGTFEGTVDFGGGARSSTYDGNDVFVAKYTAAGQHLWSRDIWGSGTEYSYGIAVNAAGDLVVTGHFAGLIDFGGGRLTTNGLADIFVAKLAGVDGGHVWSRHFGTLNEDAGKAVGFDASGNVVLTGYSRSLVDLGGGPLASAGIFLAKLTAGGQHLWSWGFGGAHEGRNVAVDGSGNVIVTGLFSGTADFGGQDLTSLNQTTDVFVAKYTSSGAHLWSQQIGGTSGDYASGLALGSAGAIVIAGGQSGTGTYLGSTLTSAGSYDFLLLNLTP